MEDRSRPSGDDKETTAVSSDALETRQSRAREGLESILSRWREVLQGENAEEDSSDDEDDLETAPTPQPRSGRLRGFLKSFMPRPEQIADDAGDRNGDTIAPFRHEAAHMPHDEPREVLPSLTTLPESAPADVIDDEPIIEPAGLEATPADIIDPIDPIDTIDADADEEEASYRRPPIPPVALPVDTGGAPVHRPEVRSDMPVPDVLPSPVDRDRSLRGAVAGLLTVDVLNYAAAKHRDNKNKAENERQHARIERSLTQEKHAREGLEARTRTLEVARTETVPVRLKEQDSTRRVEQPQIHRTAEQRKEVIHERPVRLPEVTPARPVELFERRPASRGPEVPVERVLRQVEEAAEKNIAIETLYERRHESKGAEDNANLVTASQTGVQRSAGRAGAGFGGAHGGGQPSDNYQQVNLTDAHKKELQEMYKKAAQTSSVIALILLLVYFIAVVLSRN